MGTEQSGWLPSTPGESGGIVHEEQRDDEGWSRRSLLRVRGGGKERCTKRQYTGLQIHVAVSDFFEQPEHEWKSDRRCDSDTQMGPPVAYRC